MPLTRLSIAVALAALFAARSAHAQGEPPPVAPAPARAPAVQEPPEERPDHSGMLFELAAGLAYRHVFDVPITAGGAMIVLGGQGHGSSGFAILNGTWGSTDEGLRARQFDLGGGGEGIFDALRVGGDVHFSYMDIGRRTPASSMSSFGVGLAFRLTYDIVPFEGNALFLGVRVPLDLYNGKPVPAVWGGTLMLGLRL